MKKLMSLIVLFLIVLMGLLMLKNMNSSSDSDTVFNDFMDICYDENSDYSLRIIDENGDDITERFKTDNEELYKADKTNQIKNDFIKDNLKMFYIDDNDDLKSGRKRVSKIYYESGTDEKNDIQKEWAIMVSAEILYDKNTNEIYRIDNPALTLNSVHFGEKYIPMLSNVSFDTIISDDKHKYTIVTTYSMKTEYSNFLTSEVINLGTFSARIIGGV